MIFACVIKFWDEFIEEENIEYRLVIAKTSIEATTKLVDIYGEDNILKFSIEYIGDDDTILCANNLFDEICDMIKEETV